MKKKIRDRFEEFVEATDTHGVKFLKPNNGFSPVRRALWFFILATAFAILAFIIHARVKEFLQFYVITKINTQPIGEKFPSRQ